MSGSRVGLCGRWWLAALVVPSLLQAGCVGLVRHPPSAKVGKSIPYEAPRQTPRQVTAAPAAGPAVQAPPAPMSIAKPARRQPEPRRRPANAVCLSCRDPGLILVNKQHPIMDWDIPEDLVEARIPFLSRQVASRRLLRAPAARAAERMFEAARSAGFTLYGISGFRSFETQQQVFSRNALEYGSAQKANYVSAVAGQSEHQTGLALDLTSAGAGYRLDQSFGATPEARWLQANAPRFGFILRYPKGKEAVTGYSYEPWHWRYVGRSAAEAISRRGLTLEEYIASRGTPAKAGG